MDKNSIKSAKALGKRDKLGIYSIFPKGILQELSHIENISYKSKLFIPKNYKDFNKFGGMYNYVFEGVYDSLMELWVKTYKLNKCFEIFKIYREFEPILFKGSHYRDHFIHQYLVFLTGLPMISRVSPNINSHLSDIGGVAKDLVDVEKSWLLASTYHDVSYPIQRFDDWLKAFFINFLNVKTNPVYIDMSQILLERSYLLNLHKLSDFSYQLYKKVSPVLEKDYLHSLWMKKFLERNHGVFSSLILLDKYKTDATLIDKYFGDVFFSQVLPSGVAIALHDQNVWEEEVIPQIIFEKDPITFLLIYCDTVQEWGRPITPYSIQQSPYTPLITSYQVKNSKVSVSLTYDIVENVKLQNGKVSTTFDRKKEEVSLVFSKLKSSSVCFEIALKSTDRNFGYKEFIGRSCNG